MPWNPTKQTKPNQIIGEHYSLCKLYVSRMVTWSYWKWCQHIHRYWQCFDYMEIWSVWSNKKGFFHAVVISTTAVRLRHLDFAETPGEKARWKQHKNATFGFEEILEATSQKTNQPTSHAITSTFGIIPLRNVLNPLSLWVKSSHWCSSTKMTLAFNKP